MNIPPPGGGASLGGGWTWGGEGKQTTSVVGTREIGGIRRPRVVRLRALFPKAELCGALL